MIKTNIYCHDDVKTDTNVFSSIFFSRIKITFGKLPEKLSSSILNNFKLLIEISLAY